MFAEFCLKNYLIYFYVFFKFKNFRKQILKFKKISQIQLSAKAAREKRSSSPSQRELDKGDLSCESPVMEL